MYNEQLLLKLGVAKTKLKWGVDNVNKPSSNGWGLNTDIGYRPFLYAPYLAFRYFKIRNRCMGLGLNNPKFIYIGYEIPVNPAEQIERYQR